MKKYFDKDFYGSPFEIFSRSHLIALLIIAFFIIIMCIILKNEKMQKFRKPFRILIGSILILQEFSYIMWHVHIGDFHPGHHLPFHLCGMGLIFSSLMLFTKNYTLYEIVYFWGLGGASQALITPDIGIYDFPHYRYFQMFFLSHGLLFSSVFYMTFVEKYRPYYKSLIKAIIISLIYYILIAGLNALLDGNYMFICHKPETPSILDYMGPWPWYILGVFAIGFLIYNILYLPYLIMDLIYKRKSKMEINTKTN